MERQSEDVVRADIIETQREAEGAKFTKKRVKKPYARTHGGQKRKRDPRTVTTDEAKTTSTTPDTIVAAPVVTLPSVMLLRLTYWLNTALNKSINAGMYGFRHDAAYEPCVILANTSGKNIVITHDEWKSLLRYFNEVTLCLKNKQCKTIFVPGEDCIAFGFAVRLTFGKPYVTLYRLDDEDDGKQFSRFSLTESEWDAMVVHTPNIIGYLNQLESTSESKNKLVRDSLASTERPDVYDRLAEEVYAFRKLPSP